MCSPATCMKIVERGRDPPAWLPWRAMEGLMHDLGLWQDLALVAACLIAFAGVCLMEALSG